MKFLCNTEFIHSGGRAYFPGTVYTDITDSEAEKLIALDKKKPLGALEFFTPVGEEAVNFVKTVKRNTVSGKSETTTGNAGKGTGTVTTVKQPTKQELIAEAKNLGIKGADRMNVEELTEVIAAKKGKAGQQTTDTAASETATPTGDAGKGTDASQ